MRHNLSSPPTGALNYPHIIPFLGFNGELSVVTHPEKTIKVNDVVYSNPELAPYDYKVTEILEQREAKGKHSVDFKPVFQKLKVKRI